MLGEFGRCCWQHLLMDSSRMGVDISDILVKISRLGLSRMCLKDYGPLSPASARTHHYLSRGYRLAATARCAWAQSTCSYFAVFPHTLRLPESKRCPISFCSRFHSTSRPPAKRTCWGG